jgi:hypothetical protein
MVGFGMVDGLGPPGKRGICGKLALKGSLNRLISTGPVIRVGR